MANKEEQVMDKFKKEKLEFHLPDNFKGMTKDYIMNVIFDKIVQSKWNPQIGDVIVGCTGNIFVISGEHNLVPELGGKLFFFGGGLCSRDGGYIMNETYAFTMNESGKWYAYGKNGFEEKHNLNHSSWKDFRFVPYPHELSKY